MSRHQWLLPIAVLSVAVLATAGCGNANTGNTNGQGNASTGQPVDGGTLTVATTSDIVTLNPLYLQDTASGDCAAFIFANLYDYDKNGNIVVAPWSLASEPLKVSKDGKTYTIKLKDSAKWSDGQPVTADDVVYTLNTVRNPAAGSPGISSFDKIGSIKKVDDHTVQVTLKQVYAPFAYALVTPVVPYHVLKDVPLKQLQNNPYGTDPSKMVSDGPWQWSEWKQKQYLSFKENPNYWGPKPHINQVVYKIYADENTEVQGLLKGDVDLVESIPLTQVSSVKARNDISVYEQPGPQYEYLGFNFDASNFPGHFDPFTGQKTRQAIAYALNRQGMVDNILKGTGKVLDSPFLPGTWADPGNAAVHYDYNPDKAKQLLADDGWKPGPDGVLVKDGHRFSFELQYNTGNSRRQQVAAVIQQNLAAVGIEVKPKALDFSSWVDRNLNPGKYPAILLSWQLNNPDPDQETTFSSKYMPPAGQNSGWYKNPKLDALWVKGYSTVDRNQRKAVYQQVAKEISTDLPYVFLYQYGLPEGLRNRVHFADADQPQLTLPYGYFFHLQNWWIDTK